MPANFGSPHTRQYGRHGGQPLILFDEIDIEFREVSCKRSEVSRFYLQLPTSDLRHLDSDLWRSSSPAPHPSEAVFRLRHSCKSHPQRRRPNPPEWPLRGPLSFLILSRSRCRSENSLLNPGWPSPPCLRFLYRSTSIFPGPDRRRQRA